MRGLDFLALSLCCLFWGGNFVLSKWILADHSIPPLFFATLRFALLAILMVPFLFPLPQKFGKLCLAALCVGAIHLALLYTGLRTAPASSGSIVAQMMIPFATILSMVFLKEKVGRVRAFGIIGAFIGVIILIYDPNSLSLDIGLIYIATAFMLMAVGSVLIKGVIANSQFQYLAWMGVLAVPLLGLSSLLVESDQILHAKSASWQLGVGVVYTAICVSIFAHGQYFRLLKKYDVTLIVPLTLMTPFWGVTLGVLIRGEPFNMRFVLGAVLILGCVYIIARRQPKSVESIQ